jgi:pyruvate formate lyase activating enzyme
MKISGLQKLSLVDFDGHLCATIFTYGCNFKCPFCHNSSLVISHSDEILEKDIFDFLEKRKKQLDSVCISGGEPTLHNDLPQFIKKIKDLGFLVKLDTNGTNLEMLKYLIENKLVDYIAMDIKNSIENYSLTTNCNINTDNIEKTIKYIMTCGIDYEFRTTLVSEFHTIEDIKKISKLIKGAKKYYLQKFVDNDNCISSNLHEINKATALEFKEILIKNIPNTNLRGY